MYDTLICERRGAGMWATLTRPKEMNAISPALIQDLDAVLTEAACADDVAALVITGTGNAFCAGADLKFMQSLDGDATAISVRFLHPLTKFLRRLRALPKPVIAVVNGYCVAGGLELVLCCDLVVAAERGAVFSDGHARYGLMPAIGGPHGLVRSVGSFKAKEMLFTSDRYSAAQMERVGLVNWVVSDEDLVVTTEGIVSKLAERSQAGLATMKQMVNDGADMPWDQAARYDLLLNERHNTTSIPKEGFQAFVDRRRPSFGTGPSPAGAVEPKE